MSIDVGRPLESAFVFAPRAMGDRRVRGGMSHIVCGAVIIMLLYHCVCVCVWARARARARARACVLAAPRLYSGRHERAAVINGVLESVVNTFLLYCRQTTS